MTGSKLHRRLRRDDGAAAVEFALIVGLLAMLIFGMTEFGLAFWQMQTLRGATREGARVAAVGGTGLDVRDAVRRGASMTTAQLPDSVILISTSPNSGNTSNASKPCTYASQPADSNAAVTVTLASSVYTNQLKSVFSIDIPLIPKITLTPTISGSFRCEVTS